MSSMLDLVEIWKTGPESNDRDSGIMYSDVASCDKRYGGI